MSEGASRTGRRRSGAAPRIKGREGPNLEKVLFFVVLALGPLVLAIWWVVRDPPTPAKQVPDAQLGEVRSTITQVDDSLEVIVAWELNSTTPFGKPDSILVSVVPQVGDTLHSTHTSDQLADTLRMPAPAPGVTALGYSCVTAHYDEEPLEQNCTPWQFVRPAAVPDSSRLVQPKRIVIQPNGLQVDPDLDGTCARWQLAHPNESAWIVVNRTAVPACTGPNQKPTVAQFCAFAVLPDGRRVKTANSINNPYCNELFEEWLREMVS